MRKTNLSRMVSSRVSGYDFSRADGSSKANAALAVAMAAAEAVLHRARLRARRKACLDAKPSLERTRLFVVMAYGFLLIPLFSAFVPAQQIQFRDITSQAGIHFMHNNGAFGKKYLPETMGSGCAFIDYDNDGWADILLVNSEDWPGHKRAESTLKLYHNNHDGTFTDVTSKAGLGISMYGMGVAVGDYDNDGYDDLFISALGQSHLFHNNGDGTFTDATKAAGLWGLDEFS